MRRIAQGRLDRLAAGVIELLNKAGDEGKGAQGRLTCELVGAICSSRAHASSTAPLPGSTPSPRSAHGREEVLPGGSAADSQLDRQVYGNESVMAREGN
jgi:hypothetical protein